MQADEIETQVKPSNVGTWRLLFNIYKLNNCKKGVLYQNRIHLAPRLCWTNTGFGLKDPH